MALVKDFCLILTSECTVFQFQDKINWGTPEQDRAQGANILLAAHITEDNEEEFATVDSTPVQSKILYDVTNSVDGDYIFELLRFPIHNINENYIKEVKDSNGIITTYASLIYYPGNFKFYKAIEPSLNVLPDAVDGTTYWTEITDFTADEIRSSNAITIYDYRDVYACRSKKCVKDALISLGCGCDDLKKMLPVYKRKALLNGAQALADNQQHHKAETNIRVLENLCPKC